MMTSMDAILLSSHYNSEWLQERIFMGRRPYSSSLAGKVVKEAIKSQASVGFRLEFEEFDDFEIFSSSHMMILSQNMVIEFQPLLQSST